MDKIEKKCPKCGSLFSRNSICNCLRKIWTIYASGQGWEAWNCRERWLISLVSNGSFSEAVAEFERKVGQYYD